MLKSSEHLESFYHFLASHGNGVEMGLVFWLAVEDMKDSIADKKMCSTKIRRIMRRFFKDGVDISKLESFCHITLSLLLIASTKSREF